ncbi:MAG: hypothetical protein EHM13_04850, partial [Acidobacteria bacterium]
MTRHFFRGVGVFLFAGVLALAGCSGDNGSPGAPGTDGQDLTAAAKPESCEVCHSDAGSSHQAIYNQYKDSSTLALTIEGISSSDDGAGTFNSTMTVVITKNGAPYVDAELAGLEQKRFYAFDYDASTRKFVRSINYSGKPAHLGNGRYTVAATKASFAPESSNAQAYAYVADGPLASEGMTLYNDVASAARTFSADVDSYVSGATVAGCEKCHGKPYLKHGYRTAEVEGLPDFVACKACHLDETAGGHQGWQLLVDDPAAYAAQDGVLTAEQKTKYAYKRSVMNDTHMSHAMEFAYPQSMANCATCHEGKLNAVLTDANFTLATCKSCHPVTAVGGADSKRAPALKDILPAAIHTMDLYTYADASPASCNFCHKAGAAPTFSAIHSGYDKKIYASADGKKYSEAFKVTIGEASLSGNVLTVKFSAAEAFDVAGLAVTDITPTVMIGLYGYDTKDYIVSAHGRDDGVNRNLEWVVGETHPRFAAVSAAGGAWEVTANLTDWADKIADGTIKRAEI